MGVGVALAVGLSALVVVGFRMWTSGTRDGGLEHVACRADASRLLLWDTLDRVLFAMLLMTAGRMMMDGWGSSGGLPSACGKVAIRSKQLLSEVTARDLPDLDVPPNIVDAIEMGAASLVWANMAAGREPDIDGAVSLASTLIDVCPPRSPD